MVAVRGLGVGMGRDKETITNQGNLSVAMQIKPLDTVGN